MKLEKGYDAITGRLETSDCYSWFIIASRFGARYSIANTCSDPNFVAAHISGVFDNGSHTETHRTEFYDDIDNEGLDSQVNEFMRNTEVKRFLSKNR